MSSHLSRNDLHRKYRHLKVQIVPTSAYPPAKWSVELPNRGSIGLARNLIEAQSFIESYIDRTHEEQEKSNAQRQGTDHSNASSAEQPSDSRTSQPDNQSDDPGPVEQ